MEDVDHETILTRKECEEIAKKALNSNDIRNLDYQVEHLSNITGYLGDYFKITITLNCDNTDKKIHVFAKTLPKSVDSFRTMAFNSFKKEDFIYNKYFHMIKSKGFGDILDFTATLYLSRPEDIVVLEDLVEQGYTTLHPTAVVDYDLMERFMLRLAQFHSCSLLLEESETARTGKPYRIGDEFPEFVSDYLFSNDNETCVMHRKSVDTIANYIVKKFPDIPKKITVDQFSERVMELKEDMFTRSRRSINTSTKYRNVLSHGDAWLPNFLIKKDEHGKVLDTMLIDFQLVRYNPPVLDLIMAIYLSTDKEFRSKYLRTLLENYYKELSTILSKYGYDVCEILDYDNFLESFEDLKATGITAALCYAHGVLMRKDKLQRIHSSKELSNRFYGEEREVILELLNVWEDTFYTTRIRELIEDLYQALEKTE